MTDACGGPAGAGARGAPGRVRLAAAALVALLAVPLAPRIGGAQEAAGAQEPASRVRTQVTYIAGSDVYVSAGRARGLVAGDTVRVLREGGEAVLGVLVVRSSTEERAVLTFAGAPFPVTRGAVLLLEPSRGAAAEAKRSPVEESRPRDPAPTPAAPVRPRPARSATGPRLDGRVSLDVDALRSVARWGPDADQRTVRDHAIPTLALRATASRLPGGLRLETNLRASYRHATGGLFDAPTRVRVYEAALEKDFDRIPLRLRAGRFYSPYAVYGGYWDGVMAHYGGREGLGGGLAFGFAPERGNGGLTTDRPRWSVFLDYHRRGARLRYDADLSFQREWSREGGVDDRSIAWSQRIGLDRLRLGHHVQASRDPADGAWRIARARADLGLTVARGLELYGGWGLERSRLLWFGGPGYPERRVRSSIGAAVSGRFGSIGVDAGEVRGDDGASGRSLGGYYHLYPGALGLSFSGSARYWTDGDIATLHLAPAIGRAFGPARVRAAYTLHRTAGGRDRLALHGGELSLRLPLPGRLEASLTAQRQWDDALSSTRLLTGLWLSF